MVFHKVSACIETERETVLYSKHFVFVTSQKCPYHVTFDLDPDLEHILDAGSSEDHHVQVWCRSSHFSSRRSDLRKMITDGQTDRQTDRRTDDERRTIALAHGMS